MKQRILLAITVLAILFATAVAQGQTNQPAQGAGRRGMAMNGQRQAGEITAINADSWTVRTESGSSVTVNLTSDTRYMKDGEAAKADDFKIGDHIMVIGPSTGENAISARAVASISGGGGMGRGAARMTQMPEGLGTKFIAG